MCLSLCLFSYRLSVRFPYDENTKFSSLYSFVIFVLTVGEKSVNPSIVSVLFTLTIRLGTNYLIFSMQNVRCHTSISSKLVVVLNATESKFYIETYENQSNVLRHA